MDRGIKINENASKSSANGVQMRFPAGARSDMLLKLCDMGARQKNIAQSENTTPWRSFCTDFPSGFPSSSMLSGNDMEFDAAIRPKVARNES